MRTQHFGSAMALCLAVFLSACEGSKSQVEGLPESTGFPSASGIALAPESDIQPDEAARLAKQASFGPTPELISGIIAKKSASAWLNEQFTLATSSYADLAAKVVPGDHCEKITDITTCTRENFSATPVQMRFYANAVSGNDQLRQRVAFGLSQIVVASEASVHNTAGLATFQQILLSNAFGNYRDILKAVTLNPYMGDYLDMANSVKGQPNENYARELMQLFSVGPVLLNPDGTAQADNTGATIATYSNTDVKEIARALTGWTHARFGGAAPTNTNNLDWSNPMVQYPTRFDTGSKTFLGTSVAAGATQLANVDAVVDTIFNHPNTAPYISKRLIQQLTLANPSPAYVERVAAVFADNGAGLRGDLKAVVQAIYLDSEARVVSQLPGKVKEPVLLATSLARAIGHQTDGYVFVTRDTLGQNPFRAPSVFGFYSYDFPLPLGDGLISPVSKLMTTSTVAARHNLVYDWTVGGDETRAEFKPIRGVGTVPNWASWEALGTDHGKIVDRINLVMLNGGMTKAQRQSVLTAMAAVKNSNPVLQTRRRAQVALYIVASSPLFQVDR